MANSSNNGLVWLFISLLVLIAWCVYRILRRGISGRTLRDWSLYLGAGLLVIAGVALAVYARLEADAIMQWLVPLVTAFAAFAYPLWDFRRFPKPAKYWLALSLLVPTHFLLFLWVLPLPLRGNPVLIALAGLPEMVIVYVVLGLSLGRDERALWLKKER